MQKQLLPEAEGYARTNVRRRIWRRFVRVMACIVVFCTTYALILPAITLEREGVCELEEHTHSDACYSLQTAQEVARLSCTLDSLQIHTHTRDCYGADNELLCGFADFVVHEHSGACFDAAGNLVCTLPVVREHEHTDECYEPVHVHTEDCYIPEGELICELEEIEAHSHDETCTEAVLVCELTVEPHEHTDGCYEQLVCQLPEDENHTHDDSCSGLVLVCSLTEQPHTHDESCYETEYVCGLEETEGHTHEESCYASEETLICEEEEAAEGEDPRGELVCEEEEIILHTHDDACYEVTKDAEGNEIRTLICQKLEIREHVHDESCFVTETVELDTQTLTCTETDEAHEHTDRCYGTWVLTCGLEEHTHTEECYPETREGECDCEYLDEDDLSLHSDECTRKIYAIEMADDLSAEQLYEKWPELPRDIRHFVLRYLKDSNYKKHLLLSNAILEESNWAALSAEELYIHWQDLTATEKYEILCFVKEVQPEKYEALNQLRIPNVDSETRAVVARFLDVTEITPYTEMLDYLEAKRELDLAWGIIQLDSTDTPDEEQAIFDAAEQALEAALEGYDMSVYDSFGAVGINDAEIAVNDILLTIVYRYYDAFDVFDGEFDVYLEAYSPVAVPVYEMAMEYADTGIQPFADSRFDSVWGDSTPNIRVNLFNYGSLVRDAGFMEFQAWGLTNKHDELEEMLKPNTNQSFPLFDSLKNSAGETDIINGYPWVKDWIVTGEATKAQTGSWQYLFDKTPGYYVSGGGNAAYTDQNGNYAIAGFQVDDLQFFKYDPTYSRYTYDSRYHAAYYDAATRSLKSYNHALRAFYLGNIATGQGTFMPFNKASGTNCVQIIDANGTPLTDTIAEYPGMASVYTEHINNTDGLCAVVPGLYALTGGEGNRTDLAFGMSLEFEFFMPKDGMINGQEMVFDFRGDDDFVVFIDGEPVLNLGGPRAVTRGTINFATGEVTVYNPRSLVVDPARSTTLKEVFNLPGDTFDSYTKHTLKFYYMERWGDASNCYLDFNMPTIPEKSLTVTKDVATGTQNQEIKDFIENSLSYKFRVVKAGEDGKATNELFITPGMSYDLLEGGVKVGTGTVGTDGTFSLKAGQSAQFTDMLVKGEGAVDYVVQEIMPDDLTGQYSGVEYEVSGQGGQTVPEEGPTSDFTSFDTGKLSAESTQTVTFRNKVDVNKLSILKISKALAPSAKFEEGKIFRIQVKLGGQLLPVGTKYQVVSETTDETREVKTAGIVTLKIGETATILEGIISGTEFEITELGAENGGFTPSYSGIITHKDGSVTAAACTANDASGEFTLNSVAHVTVTNANYDFSGQIPIYKQALDNDNAATFSFLVEQGTWENGVWTKTADIPGTSITVNDAAEHPGTITIGYDKDTNATFYYKIYEQRGTGDYVYDTSWYIVEVAVTPEGTDGQGTARITKIWKNGTEATDKILFVNQKTTSLMVSKRVTGAISNGSFDFRAVVVDKDGKPFNLPDPTGSSYTVEGNVAIFKLSAGQSIEIKGIPYGAKVTVTETQHDGFVAYYQVSGVHAEQQLGDSVVVTFANGVQTVTFINDGGYELPDTGGTGTYLYTMGGALLTCAAILLYIHNLKRRKEERPSF